MTVQAPSAADHVVLIDEWGRSSGVTTKESVHHHDTPFHLAFSCHVADPSGRVLLTRRAPGKRTWPATWSNACCGHPRHGETLRAAVMRRLDEELGLVPTDVAVVLPDFAYRATMPDGTTEHELCPVVVARVDGEPRLDEHEADAAEWTSWPALVARARMAPESLSPWAVEQVIAMATLEGAPRDWLEAHRDCGAWLLDLPSDRYGSLRRVDGRAIRIALDDTAVFVNTRIDAFVADRRAELRAVNPAVDDVAAAIYELVARGGKRLRPGFVRWGAAATGRSVGDGLIDAAAAVEMLHTFALLHDDVMDRSATRRGASTAHVALRERWPADVASSDPLAVEAFGTNAAILAGDLAFVWADALFDQALDDAAPEVASRARAVFTRLRSEVIAGQYLDLRLTPRAFPTASDALEVALWKTARYTVTRPLQLGAALASGSASIDGVLESYGDAVGLAFQLRDDVIGLFGDEALTGKSRLDDLREGKRTLLVVRALELASGRQRATILDALGNRSLGDDAAARCRETIAATGALASVELFIADRFEHACSVVEHFEPSVREAFIALAEFAAYRCA